MLRILALEPYLARSHEQFLSGLAEHSRNTIEVWSLPARKWKWRMRTASLHYAGRLDATADSWDLILASDYVNLAELRGVASPRVGRIPCVSYFHENQLTYPLQPNEFRDYQYAMTHIHQMLCSQCVMFNSSYHREEFLGATAELLRLVPDVEVRDLVARLRERSRVLPLGIDDPRVERGPGDGVPIIAWNHRWEYDKNPAAFLEALIELDERALPFRLLLLGQRFRTIPPEFRSLLDRLSSRVVDSEFRSERSDYLRVLATADIVVSSAIHEFFGLGTLEAIRAGLYPVLPNDLAYPELLPDDARRALHLYERSTSLADALARACAEVRTPSWPARRRVLQDHTDRFHWSELAPRYDTVFEEVVAAHLDS
ncbi:MAG: DUF3524 domain-containing protein [Planctomycetes bacterium]|nr:DUF3524 domain-containing protein [Planctomycetota bacterium]